VEGRDLRASLGRAARYAAHSITRRGTQKSYATLAEFESFEAGL
jgi:ribokinase